MSMYYAESGVQLRIHALPKRRGKTLCGLTPDKTWWFRGAPWDKKMWDMPGNADSRCKHCERRHP